MTDTDLHISDQRITLFYFFDHHCPLANIRSNDITSPALFADAQATTPLWQAHSYNLSKDLISPIHQLFHDHNRAITSWQFNKQQLRHINQADIRLTPRKRSAQRLQQEQNPQNTSTQSIQLLFEQLLHHQFHSGFSIATLELTLRCNAQQPTLQQLNESIAALARFNTLHLEKHNTSCTLGQLIRQLHGETSHKNDKAKRVYTHTYLQTDSPLTAQHSQDLISRLALHYTSDYQPKNTQGRVETIDDYHNVTHALAQEGSATLVQRNPNDTPEILKDYKNAVIRPAHQPIHLLAVHLENAMQHYQQLISHWSNQTRKYQKNAGILADIEQQLRNFRLNYFHPVISHINSHNHMQQKLYRVKQLDAQFNHLGKTTEIISQLIKNQHQTRYCKLASFGVAAAGYLTSFSIIKEGIEAINEWQTLKQTTPHLIEYLHHYTGSISLGGSLIISLIIWIIVHRHCKHSDHHSHSASHHALEALHKRHPLE